VIQYLKLVIVALLFATPASTPAQSLVFLNSAAERSGLSVEAFNSTVCDHQASPVARRVLLEYGAIFISAENVLVPSRCIFEDSATTKEFQARADLSDQSIGGTNITLQAAALEALNSAIKEAASQRLQITPRGGSIAGLRSYEDTVRLWDSRFYKALAHWEGRGKISKEDARAARKVSPFEQVPLALNWEAQGYWFSTGFNRTILSSVAAPGTSQHLTGLALDVTEFANPKVRAILNKHGWFQTVADDTPHFTYLGRAEEDLPKFGLVSVAKNGYKFWIPSKQ
jgi:hypothetical protein